MKTTTIKLLNIFGLTFSLLCVLSSCYEQDWSEVMAWTIVSSYYLKDIFLLKW